MLRHDPKKSEPSKNEASPQATPPAEREADRLVRTGIAMTNARDKAGGATTSQDVERAIEQDADFEMDGLTPEALRIYAEFGRQDPRPFMERLKRSCQELRELCHNKNEHEAERLVEGMQSTLANLELVLAVRRYGGRPKGTRKRVLPDGIENLRKWKAGDRIWVSGESVADVAKKLKVSRQTVYTILDEIRESENESAEK